MTERPWGEIDRIAGELLDVPAHQRQARLDSAALAPAARERVLALLSAWDRCEGFLETPVHVFMPEAAERLLGRRLGPWLLTSVAGSGGMGTVFVAERDDGQFKQRAAVKVMSAGALTRAGERRSHEERQILARLEHPRVARLIDGGISAEGLPYLVMEFVDGVPVDQWCRDQSLDRRARLLLLQVCEAVQFAHESLIAHCDLKPGNILVTHDGSPKLLDFGVARLLESAPAETATTLRPMTVDYASPEQVRGLRVTAATDIYSLGVICMSCWPGGVRTGSQARR